MKKSTKNFLLGTSFVVGAAALAAFVSHETTKQFVSIAFDRKEPKHMEKSREIISGSDFWSKIYQQRDEAGQKLKDTQLETVEIGAADGIKLMAHLYRAPNAKRTILAVHGWRSTWDKDFGIATPFWQENDCNILYIEQRGQGESGGDYMGFGLIERLDCLDWINWLNANGFDNLPIYLAGISMGATTVLMAAGLDLPDNVKGISADCAFTSPHAIWKHILEKNLHIPYTGVMASIVNDMCKKKIQVSPDDYTCAEALKNCKVPVLFVHGTDDTFVPVNMTYENYKACASPKKLLIVPGADHGISYLVEQQLYQDTVKQFWAENDQL